MSKLTFQESRTGALLDATDGSYPVVLLTPGQGATAYYSEEVIRRDAPSAFPRGTHVYLNHLQEGETRSPEKILGTLVDETVIREDGAAVNRFKPVKRWQDLVEDVHKIAGLSINAAGSAKLGMINGRTTRIAESIDYHIANSVDLVSYPGRPGSGFTESYDSLYQEAMAAFEKENVQPESPASGNQEEDEQHMTDEKLDKLVESVAALATLVESALPKPSAPAEKDPSDEVKAAIAALTIVESAELPKDTKAQLVESIKAGNYEGIEAEVTRLTAFREELKTQFTESGHGILGATGASGVASTPVVKGWGA